MNQMEQFLANLSYLKHLELIITGGEDLIDGYRWEILTKFLIIFNFKISINYNHPQLDSFRTLFWLEEKHWYINYRNGCVFSVPYFSPVHIDIDEWSYDWAETPVDDIDMKSLNSMNIGNVPSNPCPYHIHIKNLSINCSISRKQILSIVEMKQVRHLSILSITDLLVFQPYESTIPNLYELTITNIVTFDEIEQMKDSQLRQIRKLSISICNKDTNFILKGLFYCFPYIEYLTYSSDIISMKILNDIINKPVYLLHVSFYSLNYSCEKGADLYYNKDTNFILKRLFYYFP
jgi:hypothetical protein